MINKWESSVCVCVYWYGGTRGGEWSFHEETDKLLSSFSSKEKRCSGKLHTQPVSGRAELKFRVSDHKSSTMFIRASSKCLGVLSGHFEGEWSAPLLL